MKRVIIKAYEKGLVFKNGAYKHMIGEGTYWFWNNETIYIYNTFNEFIAPIELNILLQDEAIFEALYVINVSDNEIVLQYKNGLLVKVLTAGRYAIWKTETQYDFVKADVSKIEIAENIDSTTLQNKIVVPYVRSYEVQSYEKALLFVDGKYKGILEAGIYYWWKNNTTIQLVRVDTRQQQIEINGQEILTKDKAALRINAKAQYKVVDMEKAVLNNKEYDAQLYVSLQLALREYIGGLTFDELLEKKGDIGTFVLDTIKKTTDALGVVVTNFGIRDIILPGDVKEIMNKVLIAEKKAQANIIMRREETASTRSLLNTAKLMEDNTMLWKLKEMEYVEKIADKINNISVTGNGALIEQLKQIFIAPK